MQSLRFAKFELKLASQNLVEQCGGQENAAKLLGCAQPNINYMCSSTNPQHANKFFRISDIPALEGLACNPLVTEKLASIAGYTLVKLPEGDAQAPTMKETGRLAKESGEVLDRLLSSLSDGNISAKEVRHHNMLKECDDVLSVVANIKAQLVAVLEREG